MAFPTTTPRTWTVGEILTAANLNLHLRDQLNEVAAAWETDARSASTIWTTSGTQPAIGNGTLTSKYKKIGRLVTWNVNLLAGSTTTFGTNAWAFVPPFNSALTRGTGSAVFFDSSSATDFVGAVYVSVTSTFLCRGDTGGQPVSSTIPFTWVSTDEMAFTITYESTS